MAEDKKDTIVCDQCGDEIHENDARIIFALNNGFHLCSDCAQELVLNYREEMERHKKEQQVKGHGKLTPHKIKDFLDQYVIGQDKAKIILSLAVYNHYKRIRHIQAHKNDKDATEIQKSGIIILGRSGSGKTHILRTIARFLNVPFIICDMTSYSASGFITSPL